MIEYGRPCFTQQYKPDGELKLVTVDCWPEYVSITPLFLDTADARMLQRPTPEQVRFTVSNGQATYQVIATTEETVYLRLQEATLEPEELALEQ